jgi:hypothetical protein|tara:strand:- start:760 stop:1770 length:1011 start_codon:yes stop_codon:yes gene_type:complete
MADIALRSPQFKTKIVGSGSVKSMQLTLNIDGTLRYTINKDITISNMVFEISELCRDYLTVNYTSNNYPQTITIITTITSYDGVNGTGNVVGTPTVFNDVGWEAYGLYVNGSNPVNPVDTVVGTWLIAPIKSESYSVREFEIFAPIGEDGFVAGITSTGSVFSSYYNGTSTGISSSAVNENLKITRINCSKYGNGRKINFINQYGVGQDLWFSLKETQSLSRKNENYKANTLINDGSDPYYTLSNAPVKTFNTQAKKSYTLNSGYYPEGAVEYFEQLLLSEYVWMIVYNKNNPASELTIPVRVKSSSIELKKSVNNRLINYTIEFEDAFDYINNIR